VEKLGLDMTEQTTPKKPLAANILKARETIKKHKSMSCHVYQTKIQTNHLSCKTLKHLNQLFTEAKWFYNHCIQNISNLSDVDTTIKSVSVKTPTGLEERTFKALSSQMKQAIKQSIFISLKTFNTIRQKNLKKGQKQTKVGKLKFKKSCLSIPLTAHGKKYSYVTDFETSRVHLQGLQPWIKVNGLNQIPKDSDICNAVLIKKGSDFFIHITTFSSSPRKQKNSIIKSNIPLGIDLGCSNQLTTSEGHEIQFNLPVNKSIKRLDRKIMKKDFKGNYRNKRGKNKLKDQLKRKIQYSKLTNQKQDIQNKIVSFIRRHYAVIILQDDDIAAWKKGGHGKKIQGTGIGRIKSGLKNKSETSILVSQWYASSQTCSECGFKQKMARGIDKYICPSCRMEMGRDVNGARTIRDEGLRLSEKTLIQNNLCNHYKVMKEEDNKNESDRIKSDKKTKQLMACLQTSLEDSSTSCLGNEPLRRSYCLDNISTWGEHADGFSEMKNEQKLQEKQTSAMSLFNALKSIKQVSCKLVSVNEEAPVL
jgi:putative transposase